MLNGPGSGGNRFLRLTGRDSFVSSQAAGGYVTYNEKTRKFSLSEEQAFTPAKEDSAAYIPGAFQ